MHEKLLIVSDIVGMMGVSFVLLTYYFLSIGKWQALTWRYQLLNFIGAWLILFSLYFHWNLSSVVIEIAWLAISMIGMRNVYKNSKKKYGKFKS